MAKAPSDLKAKLRKADAMVRDYVVSLEKRNARRQREIAQLHTDKVELNGRIKALEEQLNVKKGDIRYHFPADWRPGARKIDKNAATAERGRADRLATRRIAVDGSEAGLR